VGVEEAHINMYNGIDKVLIVNKSEICRLDCLCLCFCFGVYVLCVGFMIRNNDITQKSDKTFVQYMTISIEDTMESNDNYWT
jgi:hypothetical protein